MKNKCTVYMESASILASMNCFSVVKFKIVISFFPFLCFCFDYFFFCLVYLNVFQLHPVMMPGKKGDTDDAMDYISELYLEQSLNRTTRARKYIYRHFTCATDTDNIRKVFDDVKKTVLIKELQLYGML